MRSAAWTCRRWDARSERSLHSDTAPRPSRYGRSTADLLVQAPNRFAGRRKTPVDKDRSDQRFERIGQNRGAREPAAPQLALSQLQVIAQPERLRQLMQGLLAHQLRAQPRQIPLGNPVEAFEQLGCDHAVENAVAQELQALVVKGAVAAVREGPQQQLGPGKRVSDLLLKALPVHGLCRRAG